MSSNSKNELGDELRAYRRLGDATRQSRPLAKRGRRSWVNSWRLDGEDDEGGGEKGREYGREMDPWGVSLPLTRPEANWPESRVAFPSSGSGIMADLHVSRQANSRPAGWSSEHEELL